jgi:tetratricopeptide (TPR) repeat protein
MLKMMTQREKPFFAAIWSSKSLVLPLAGSRDIAAPAISRRDTGGRVAGRVFDIALDLKRGLRGPKPSPPRPTHPAFDFALHRLCAQCVGLFCFCFADFWIEMTHPRPSPAPDLDALRRAEAAGAHVMAARNALRKGERNRAKELVKAAFAENPGDIAAVEFLGDLFLEEGETQQALQLFERAHTAHPSYAPFEEKLAICRLDLAEIESDKTRAELI